LQPLPKMRIAIFQNIKNTILGILGFVGSFVLFGCSKRPNFPACYLADDEDEGEPQAPGCARAFL
jgi:hypothetical protein